MGKMTRPNIVIINLKCWSILGSLSIFYQHQHVLSTRQSNFQLSVESYSGLVWFHLSSHCYWSRRFAPSPQPIRCKTKNNRDLVRRIFPRFKQFACFHYLIATSRAHCSEVLTCDIPGFPRINIRTISRNMRNSR